MDLFLRDKDPGDATDIMPAEYIHVWIHADISTTNVEEPSNIGEIAQQIAISVCFGHFFNDLLA